MVPVRKLVGKLMETNCVLVRAVWVVKPTVTDLPVAKGMRSTAAMLTPMPVTWPPSATIAPVAGMSVDVDTVTPLAEPAMGPPKVAPVRVRIYEPGAAPALPTAMVTPLVIAEVEVAKVLAAPA